MRCCDARVDLLILWHLQARLELVVQRLTAANPAAAAADDDDVDDDVDDDRQRGSHGGTTLGSRAESGAAARGATAAFGSRVEQQWVRQQRPQDPLAGNVSGSSGMQSSRSGGSQQLRRARKFC